MNEKKWYVMARLDLTERGEAVLSSLDLLSDPVPSVAGKTIWLSVSREGPATRQEAQAELDAFMRFYGKSSGLVPAYVDPDGPFAGRKTGYIRPLPCGHPANARDWVKPVNPKPSISVTLPGDPPRTVGFPDLVLGPCILCEKSSPQSP